MMEVGLVRRVDIDVEMQQSYLDYAMSVIVSRALPDARDGLKPVQRRILYAMYDMGLRPDGPYKKSARIVGEVLGKYHPHGDLAVYEAMARMAQDFSMRNALVDGQGNFGSVDGDPPAAMRYTEARLTPLAMEMLNQLDRNTVNFANNFDESLREPEVLPAAIPNLLVNGGSGIAVGMATSIPPHNLQEVIDALVFMLHRWEHLDDVGVSDLMQYVHGPDFPTGGIILQECDKDDLQSAYATGRGRVILRGKVHLEEGGRGRSRIIISELPYQTNKAALMERIATLVREGDLDGIADLRDESDRQGMRIVVELNKTAEPEKVLRELYRRTSLQTTFRISLLALVDNEPRLLSLKQALRVYLEHRLEVVRRRSEFDLARARQRAHILAGLRIAIANLDAVIALIRKSQDADQARQRLMKQYKLDEVQAQAILDMPLRRLASLERKKIEDEYKELQQTIKALEALLASPKKLRGVVEDELLAMRDRFGDRRRTQIVRLSDGEQASDLLTTNDLTPGQPVWIGVTHDGLIGRSHGDKLPRISGREAPRWVFHSSTRHTLYLVNKEGRATAIPVHALPEVEAFSNGVPFQHVSPFREENGLAAVFSTPSQSEIKEERFVMTVSRKGMVKKSPVGELPGPTAQLFTLVKINEGDELGWVLFTTGQDQIFLATSAGNAIRFSEQEVRPMGLAAAGVNGIKLSGQDDVVGAEVVADKTNLLLIASDGRSWHNIASGYPLQGRYGQGVIAAKLGKAASLAGVMSGKTSQTGMVYFAQAAARNVRIGELPVVKRATAGQALVPVKAGDRVVGVTPVVDRLDFWGVDGLAAENGTVPAPRRRRAPQMETQTELVSVAAIEETHVQEPASVDKPARASKRTVKAAAEPKTSRRAAKSAEAAKPVASRAKTSKESKTAEELKTSRRTAKSAAEAKPAAVRSKASKEAKAAVEPKKARSTAKAAEVAKPAGSTVKAVKEPKPAAKKTQSTAEAKPARKSKAQQVALPGIAEPEKPARATTRARTSTRTAAAKEKKAPEAKSTAKTASRTGTRTASAKEKKTTEVKSPAKTTARTTRTSSKEGKPAAGKKSSTREKPADSKAKAKKPAAGSTRKKPTAK